MGEYEVERVTYLTDPTQLDLISNPMVNAIDCRLRDAVSEWGTETIVLYATDGEQKAGGEDY